MRRELDRGIDGISLGVGVGGTIVASAKQQWAWVVRQLESVAPLWVSAARELASGYVRGSIVGVSGTIVGIGGTTVGVGGTTVGVGGTSVGVGGALK